MSRTELDSLLERTVAEALGVELPRKMKRRQQPQSRRPAMAARQPEREPAHA
jgi:hypothetical protein